MWTNAALGDRCSGVIWWVDAQVATDLPHELIADLGMRTAERRFNVD
jgi:hypothetical protein